MRPLLVTMLGALLTLSAAGCGGGASDGPPPSTPQTSSASSDPPKASYSRTCEGLDNKAFGNCISGALTELRFQDVIDACARKEGSLTRNEEIARLQTCSAYLVISAEMTNRREGGNI